MSKNKYTDEEKALVEYLKSKLISRGIVKFPRDWHLKQLSSARYMLAGDNAPNLDEWKACIDWCLADKFWCDKVDHLAAVERLRTKYSLQGNKAGGLIKSINDEKKKSEMLDKLYMR
ncbi:hypothetical protein DCCM_3231 [Desulfocucumis palustris]|uniref:Uncharacterized protein n=1 Tax=Desulfocucumis palustris TaxID=1898651 RepID=A0A2L2XCQ3_9FIRM|nr:hypothetical protein [Desulfocucumis palustris]GBF34119.1 hypothetical protein DCCM_3231 [Desulfocucumis palustris]